MGLLNKLFGNKEREIKAESAAVRTVASPLSGILIPLEKIPDATFAEGILGPGCGIEPSGETVYAPFDGEVSQIAATCHAVGLTSSDGIELLIHVGLDTVKMNGRGFTMKVKEGQKVKAGQPLLAFDRAEIKKEGYPVTTAVIVTNGDEYSSVKILAEGEVSVGKPILYANGQN